MVHIGYSVVKIGKDKDTIQLDKLKGIGEEISTINKELRETVSFLKRELDILKSKEKGDHYDITKFHEKLIDFQEIYNRGKEENHPDLLKFDSKEAYENLKKYEKSDFEKLSKQLEDVETHHKDRASDAGQELLLEGHKYTLIMNILQEALRSYSRSQERLAQASRSH